MWYTKVVCIQQLSSTRVHASSQCIKHLRTQCKTKTKTVLKDCFTYNPQRQHHHQTPFTPKQLLHKKAVRTKTFNTIHQPWHQPPHTSYTRHLLHQTPSTPGTFYTKAPFTPNIFYNKQFLHLPPFTSNKPDIFYAKETFALVAFYTRHLWHQTLFTPNAFHTKQLLYQKPFAPDAFYTRNLLHQAPFP